jgi:hypothetical protein
LPINTSACLIIKEKILKQHCGRKESIVAEFLTTRGTSSAIEKIINDAEDRLVLISPFVKIPDTLFQNLKVADRRPVKITLVYGKDELKPDVKNQLKQLNNLSLRFLKELHAKCFFNEECMVITSMNLYDFSEINNKEMGVLVTVKDDPDVFEKAREEADRIVGLAEEVKLRRSVLNGAAKVVKLVVDSAIKDDSRKSKPTSKTKTTSRTKQTGYCIRCGKNIIPLDVKQPLCHDCWEKWNIHKNPSYKEKYCHICGKRASTSMARPQCNSCYKPRG